jgi:hypothetical protein
VGGTVLVYGSYANVSAAQQVAALAAGDVVFEWDERAPADLVDRGVVVRTFDDYFAPDDFAAIDAYAATLPTSGFLLDDEDLTEWKGVSLASVAAVEMSRVVSIMTNVVCATRVLQSARPGRVVVGGGLGIQQGVWARVAADLGIQVVLPPRDPSVEVATQWRPTKSRPVHDSAMARWRRRFVRQGRLLMSKARPKSERACVLLSYPADRLVWTSVVGGDFDLAMLSEAANPLYADLLLAWERRRAHQVFRRRWQRVSKSGAASQMFRFQGYDLWPHLAGWLEHFVTSRLPLYAGFLARARYRLRKRAPWAMTVWPPFSPEVGLTAIAARENGVKTVLVQHEWSGGARYLLRPPAVDYVLCWGELSRKRFEEIGYTREQIFEVGYPLLESVTVPPTNAVLHGGSPPRALSDRERKLVLFADQYYQPTRAAGLPLDRTVRPIEALASAARALPDVDFVMKFHPKTGSNDRHEPFDALQRRVNRIASTGLRNFSAAALESSLRALLTHAAVFVTHYSTSAIEAMLAGVPVILLNVTAERTRWPGLEEGIAPYPAATAEELIDLLRRLLHDDVLNARAVIEQRDHLARIFRSPPEQVRFK